MDARPITALLLLALCLWWSWRHYFRHVRAARKWAEEQQRARMRMRSEEKAARDALMKGIAQRNRERNGDNHIYEDWRDE